jgi:hypothetical protein
VKGISYTMEPLGKKPIIKRSGANTVNIKIDMKPQNATRLKGDFGLANVDMD